MSFTDADAYDRFMGRYSRLLAPPFADFAGVREGVRTLDVGCGPGVLTTELVDRVGAANVAAVDPSEAFVRAARERLSGVNIRQGVAESLPFADGTFDAALAQLVVHFMRDPVAGIREMARVTRAGGVVAVSVWDHGGRRGPLSIFWTAARELDPGVGDESELAGTHRGQLEQLLAETGVQEVEGTELVVRGGPVTFDEWWEPYTLGVGPAGAYAASLDATRREELRERCRELASSPLVVEAYAWAARGSA